MTNAKSRARDLAAAAAAAALASAVPAAAGGEEQPVRGWLEHAHIEPSGISLDAKLDTGARTSSIHAEILRGPDLEDEDEGEDEVVVVAEPEAPAADVEQADGEAAAPAPAEQQTADAAAAQTDAQADAPAADAQAADAQSADASAADAAPEEAGEIGGVEVEVIEDESDPEFEEVEVEESDAGDDNTIVFRITNEQGESSTLQREVVRFVEIKNRDGTTERRPVVEITACLAGVWVTGEVNLADREDFNYPFLVGRNMLESSGIIVDAREIYTRSARCTDPAP